MSDTSDIISIEAPASKSMSHRAVIAASLADGTSRLGRVLESEDLDRTGDIMWAAGATIERTAPGSYTVGGVSGRPKGGEEAPLSVDVGESGTTCRLLTGVLAAGNGSFRIHGRGRMHDRPIGELTDALIPQGVQFSFEEKSDCPPMVMTTTGLPGGTISIGLDQSSQYLSGLLLAAPMAKAPLTVEVGGKKVVSWPYVALTLQTLEDFGVPFRVEQLLDGSWREIHWRDVDQVRPGEIRFTVEPGAYKAHDHDVEGDWSNASYFLAAGAIGPKPVAIRGLNRDSLQGDKAMLDILAQMGADIAWNGDTVTVSPAELKGVDVDMGSCPDIVPTVSVAAALSQGKTRIRNVAHLRIKESDRLQAVADELARIGCTVAVLEDGLEIDPSTVPDMPGGKEIAFKTYGDHRIAMCLSLLELAGELVALDDPGCVAKSFPGFWEQWNKVRQGNEL